jgi:hypothetical protein
MAYDLNMQSKDCYIVGIGELGYYRTMPNATSSQYIIESDPFKATIFDTLDSARTAITRIKYMQSIKDRGIKIKALKSRISILVEDLELIRKK